MATRYAVASGNWSALATWDGGASLPGSGDTVVANGFTVTIDQDVTVTEIRTLALTPAASGGGFACSATRTINATVRAGTTPCLTFSGGGGTTLTLVGDVIASSATNNTQALVISGASTVNVLGNVSGAPISASNADGINITAAATLNIVGTVTGGNGTNAFGIRFSAACVIDITGNVVGGGNSGGTAISGASAASITVVGNCSSPSQGGCISVSTGSTVVTVTGSVTAGTSNTSCILHSGSGSVAVVGDVTAGSNASAFGISVSASNVAVKGDCYAGTALGAHAVNATAATPHVHIEGDMIARATGPGQGTPAVYARNIAVYGTVDHRTGYPEAAGAMPGAPTGWSSSLVYQYGVAHAGSSSGQPAEADVRLGVVYGPSGALAGLAAIPDSASVLAGVPVDHTVGAATLTAADIRAAVGLAAASLDTQLAGIPAAVGATVTAQHGAGSYERNTEPDNASVAAINTRLPATPAAAGGSVALTAEERELVAGVLFDLVGAIEEGLTLRQAIRGIAAATFGKASGLDGTEARFRSAVADDVDRIVATVDESGNRSAVVVDLG